MLYPILFAPIYKEMVWGGTRMMQFNKKSNENKKDKTNIRELPYEHTGESWDISCRPNEMGIVENGSFKGTTFESLIALDRKAYLGTRLHERDDFPLLVKIIDANDNLSIQVHPGGENGKSEMWYVMDALKDQSLVIGLNEGTTPEMLQNSPLSCLHRLPIKKGDIINIPAGLVHALTKGIIVAEIQQNSDTTYRLYDYERTGLDGKPRELHIQEGLAVSDFQNKHPKEVVIGLSFVNGAENTARLTYAIANSYFAVIKYEINGLYAEDSNTEAFSIFTCVEGSCEISSATDKFETVTLPCSRSVFIPAGLGSYTLNGNCVLLKSFVPDVQKDFIEPLLSRGFPITDIKFQTQFDL